MQPKHRSFFLLVLCALAGLIQGCHKSNHPAATPKTRISAVTAMNGGSTTTYTLTYNSANQLANVQVAGAANYNVILTYSPNRIISQTTFNNSTDIATTDTVNLDAAGNAVSIIMASYSGIISRFDFTRNSNGELTQSTNSYNGNAPTLTTYTYTNGDITGGATAGNPFTYTYYTDKPTSLGDFLSINQWMQYGVVIYKSAHLCKSFTGPGYQGRPGTTENFTYTMDSQGNVTDVVSATPGIPNSTYHYTWQTY